MTLIVVLPPRFDLTLGILQPDNNVAENAIRPFAVGWMNRLFADSPRDATANATLYGLVKYAKANGL